MAPIAAISSNATEPRGNTVAQWPAADLAEAAAGGEAAEPAERVAQRQRRREEIAERAERPALPLREPPADQRRAGDAAVEHEAALPDREDARAVGQHGAHRSRLAAAAEADARELGRVDDAVDDARADEPGDDHPERGVEHAAAVEAAPASFAVGEGDPRRQPDGDQDAVGMERQLSSAESDREQRRKHRELRFLGRRPGLRSSLRPPADTACRAASARRRCTAPHRRC